MSLFDRIANITKATLHEALNKLEDPVLMTGQYLRNLEEDIQSAESTLKEQQITASLQQRKSDEAAELAKQSEQRAIQALEHGDEAIARHAAAAKIQYEEQSIQFANEAAAARNRITELEISIRTGKEEYKRLKEKRNELAARARKVTENSKLEREHISYGIEGGSAAKGFERMEEKIIEWESGLPVTSKLSNSDSHAVNEELERLKEQMNSRNNENK